MEARRRRIRRASSQRKSLPRERTRGVYGATSAGASAVQFSLLSAPWHAGTIGKLIRKTRRVLPERRVCPMGAGAITIGLASPARVGRQQEPEAAMLLPERHHLFRRRDRISPTTTNARGGKERDHLVAEIRWWAVPARSIGGDPRMLASKADGEARHDRDCPATNWDTRPR